ncbi:MAG: LPS export ABC transporter permease LptF [Shimia sp.]
MGRFDRYMLGELTTLFSFFALVLVLVYWVNQAVGLFDQLIADGQNARVFLEFTALSLPNIIRLVLPVAAFAAVLYVVNRMSNESELTVVQATGYSPLRLARPVAIFGLAVGAMMAVLMHVLVPISQARLAERNAEVAANASARLLREGVFLHPGAGTTFYLRETSAEGVLQDVFLSQEGEDGDTIYTADQAFLVRSETGPKLVMIDGLAQTLTPEGRRLFTTRFNDFVFDIGTLIDTGGPRPPRLRELSTAALLAPTPALLEATGRAPPAFAQEAHERLSQPFFPLVAALMGFAVLMSGGFSRFGIWRRIVVAVVLLVVLKVIEGAAAQAIARDGGNWPLAYLPYAGGLAIAVALLWSAGRSRRVPPVAPVAA